MIEHLMASAAGVGNFAIYFGLSLILLLLFKVTYTWVTPYDEWALVKENNTAAALSLVGAVLGFSVALSGAASNSVSYLDFGVWAVVALIAQLIAYRIVKLFLPRIAERIGEGEVAAGVVLAGVSVSIGVLNAACMTY